MLKLREPTLAQLGTLSQDRLGELPYPVLLSPKIDGYRCTMQEGQGYFRSGKLIPNLVARGRMTTLPNGLDGELTIGPLWADNVFGATGSGLRSVSGDPDFVFNVFDNMDLPGGRYIERLGLSNQIVEALGMPWVITLDHYMAHSPEEVLAYELEWNAKGYEGLMVRDLNAPYYFGRSGTSGPLWRFKRYYDSEFKVLAVEVGWKNVNPQTFDAMGKATRSTVKAGMVPSGLCGGFLAEDIHTGQVFNVAPGKMDHKTSAEIMANAVNYLGRIGTYRFDKKGGYEFPRFPTFQGWRIDL